MAGQHWGLGWCWVPLKLNLRCWFVAGQGQQGSYPATVRMRTTVMMTMVVMMIVTMINTSKQSVICRQVQGEKKILCAMPVFPLLLLQH